MGITLLLFLANHLYMIYNGVTTNENFRVSDCESFFAEEAE